MQQFLLPAPQTENLQYLSNVDIVPSDAQKVIQPEMLA